MTPPINSQESDAAITAEASFSVEEAFPLTLSASLFSALRPGDYSSRHMEKLGRERRRAVADYMGKSLPSITAESSRLRRIAERTIRESPWKGKKENKDYASSLMRAAILLPVSHHPSADLASFAADLDLTPREFTSLLSAFLRRTRQSLRGFDNREWQGLLGEPMEPCEISLKTEQVPDRLTQLRYLRSELPLKQELAALGLHITESLQRIYAQDLEDLVLLGETSGLLDEVEAFFIHGAPLSVQSQQVVCNNLLLPIPDPQDVEGRIAFRQLFWESFSERKGHAATLAAQYSRNIDSLLTIVENFAALKSGDPEMCKAMKARLEDFKRASVSFTYFPIGYMTVVKTDRDNPEGVCSFLPVFTEFLKSERTREGGLQRLAGTNVEELEKHSAALDRERNASRAQSFHIQEDIRIAVRNFYIAYCELQTLQSKIDHLELCGSEFKSENDPHHGEPSELKRALKTSRAGFALHCKATGLFSRHDVLNYLHTAVAEDPLLLPEERAARCRTLAELVPFTKQEPLRMSSSEADLRESFESKTARMSDYLSSSSRVQLFDAFPSIHEDPRAHARLERACRARIRLFAASAGEPSTAYQNALRIVNEYPDVLAVPLPDFEKFLLKEASSARAHASLHQEQNDLLESPLLSVTPAQSLSLPPQLAIRPAEKTHLEAIFTGHYLFSRHTSRIVRANEAFDELLKQGYIGELPSPAASLCFFSQNFATDFHEILRQLIKHDRWRFFEALDELRKELQIESRDLLQKVVRALRETNDPTLAAYERDRELCHGELLPGPASNPARQEFELRYPNPDRAHEELYPGETRALQAGRWNRPTHLRVTGAPLSVGEQQRIAACMNTVSPVSIPVERAHIEKGRVIRCVPKTLANDKDCYLMATLTWESEEIPNLKFAVRMHTKHREGPYAPDIGVTRTFDTSNGRIEQTLVDRRRLSNATRLHDDYWYEFHTDLSGNLWLNCSVREEIVQKLGKDRSPQETEILDAIHYRGWW